jgi:hypothetical protein
LRAATSASNRNAAAEDEKRAGIAMSGRDLSPVTGLSIV